MMTKIAFEAWSRNGVSKSWPSEPRFLVSFSLIRLLKKESLSCNLGGVCDGCANVLDCELGIGRDNFVPARPVRKEIEDEWRPYARALYARLAETDVRIDGNAVEG